MLSNQREKTGSRNLNDSRSYIKHLNDMDDIYKNIEEYNPNKKQKILILFDGMIADMLRNRKLYPIVIGLFIRRRKLVSLVFITKFCFAVPKINILNLEFLLHIKY